MARAAAIYDFTLTANGSFVLPVEGTYYRIRSATGSVQVKRDDGSLLELEVGQGECNQLFKRLTIVDMSGAANSGTIIVADNNFVDERVSGEVAIITGGKVRSIANVAFSGGVSAAASVGNYTSVQLWNPAGTGKRLVCPALTSIPIATVNYALRSSVAALTTAAAAPQAKILGGSAGVAEIRYDATAALPGTSNLFTWLHKTEQPPISFDEPFIIMPGFGLIVSNLTPNAGLTANFQFFEETL